MKLGDGCTVRFEDGTKVHGTYVVAVRTDDGELVGIEHINRIYESGF